MKIAHKFTAALTGLVCLALSLNVRSVVRAEIARFESEVGAHQAVIGRALRPAIVDVWRKEGEERALEVVKQANESMRDVDIRWVWKDDSAGPGYAPTHLLARSAIADGKEWVYVDTRRAKPRLFTYVPVQVPGMGSGAVEISQSLAREKEVQWAAIRHSALAALLIACGSAIASTVLGAWIVGRPLQRLIDQARRVGGGDLSLRITVRQRDELGTMAEEMNRMCGNLADAQRKIAAEMDAKLRAQEQLRHADRLATVGRLAAGMAHELGTPLNVITARAKPMITGRVSGEAIKEHARIITDQVDKMTRIMRQLLDFARKRDLQRSAVNLVPIVRRSMTLLGPMADKHQVHLHLDHPSTGVSAMVDAAQIEQVVTNLLINAVHASRPGQTVEVRLLDGQPSPAGMGTSSTRCSVISVRDDGEGIPTENQARVFEPFFTTKQVGEGTGLGLSVAHGIVADHHGLITLESEVSKGSVFSVWLPMEVT